MHRHGRSPTLVSSLIATLQHDAGHVNHRHLFAQAGASLDRRSASAGRTLDRPRRRRDDHLVRDVSGVHEDMWRSNWDTEELEREGRSRGGEYGGGGRGKSASPHRRVGAAVDRDSRATPPGLVRFRPAHRLAGATTGAATGASTGAAQNTVRIARTAALHTNAEASEQAQRRGVEGAEGAGGATVPDREVTNTPPLATTSTPMPMLVPMSMSTSTGLAAAAAAAAAPSPPEHQTLPPHPTRAVRPFAFAGPSGTLGTLLRVDLTGSTATRQTQLQVQVAPSVAPSRHAGRGSPLGTLRCDLADPATVMNEEAGVAPGLVRFRPAHRLAVAPGVAPAAVAAVATNQLFATSLNTSISPSSVCGPSLSLSASFSPSAKDCLRPPTFPSPASPASPSSSSTTSPVSTSPASTSPAFPSSASPVSTSPASVIAARRELGLGRGATSCSPAANDDSFSVAGAAWLGT